MIEEARWELGQSLSLIVGPIEASPYTFLLRTRFESHQYMYSSGYTVTSHRGALASGGCVFMWFTPCLDEDERCDHVSCERRVRRSSAI